ncbi:MAG: hypothetical protein ABSA44_14470 [Bacteroidota bacterium]|jgi:hypothetical protein
MNYTYLIISSILAIATQYFTKLFEKKVRFVMWLSHRYEFKIPIIEERNVTVFVQTVRLDNLGKLAITDVEIVHKLKPDFFAFDPPQPYEEKTLPDGSHLVAIKSIAPHSGFSMQYFCYINYPNITYIRSTQGYAEVVPVIPNIVIPKTKMFIFKIIVIVGSTTLIYWTIRLGAFLINYFFPSSMP